MSAEQQKEWMEASATLTITRNEGPANPLRWLLAEIVSEAHRIARNRFGTYETEGDRLRDVENLTAKIRQARKRMWSIVRTEKWPEGKQVIEALKMIRSELRFPHKLVLRRAGGTRVLMEKAVDQLASVAQISSAMIEEVRQRPTAQPGAVVSPRPKIVDVDPHGEPYLTVSEVAYLLNISRGMAARIFFDYPGVVNLGRGTYRKLRIPRGVLNRYLAERRIL